MGQAEPNEASEHGQGNGKKRSKCPICGSWVQQSAETAPFCSERCRKIDLGRWLGEHYRVSRSIEEADLEEGE